MSDKRNSIRRQFNRSARDYDRHGKVQRMMANELASSLTLFYENKDEAPTNVLEIGCGTGVLTELLVRRLPRSSSITALDLAPAMLDAASLRVRALVGSNDVKFLLADVESWAPDASSSSYDLIVSSACFQWLEQPQSTLHTLKRLLRPGGRLAFTTFGSDTFRELHIAFGDAYLQLGQTPQRHGLSFHTAEEWRDMLGQAGFTNVRFSAKRHIECFPSVRDFLQSVKAVGASASEAERSTGLGDRRLFAGMFQAYERKFGMEEGIAATYDLLMLEGLTADK